MLPFISLPFLFLFLPFCLVFHFLAARFGERVRLCALIALSFLFCATWDPRAAAVLAGSIVINYAIGRLLEQAQHEEHAAQANTFFAVGVVFNLGVLAIFRYADFFIGNMDAAADADFVAGKILVPLGVLFFSCDQIAYLADLRRGKNYGSDWLRYAAFVSFFPRLMAGPLLRYGSIAQQWTERLPDREDIAVGLTTFVIGLAKTVLLAGAVAPFATSVFSAANAGQKLELFSAWTGVLAFTCQIYFDLSGYSDMAIGLGRCFGLRLPTNFQAPYRAKNIAEFWRRWNITLSDFLRDYVYIPLGGNRFGTVRASINLVIAMVVGGIWYSPGQMFIAWALLHAFYLLFYRAWRAYRGRDRTVFAQSAPHAAHILSVIATFLTIALGWIIFRSADSSAAFELFTAMIGRNGALLPMAYASLLGPAQPLAQKLGIGFASADAVEMTKAWLSIALCITVIFVLPDTETLLSSYRSASGGDEDEPPNLFPLRWMPSSFWSVALGVIAFACVASAGGSATILHWRF